VCIKLVALRVTRYPRSSSQLQRLVTPALHNTHISPGSFIPILVLFTSKMQA